MFFAGRPPSSPLLYLVGNVDLFWGDDLSLSRPPRSSPLAFWGDEGGRGGTTRINKPSPLVKWLFSLAFLSRGDEGGRLASLFQFSREKK